MKLRISLDLLPHLRFLICVLIRSLQIVETMKPYMLQVKMWLLAYKSKLKEFKVHFSTRDEINSNILESFLKKCEWNPSWMSDSISSKTSGRTPKHILQQFWRSLEVTNFEWFFGCFETTYTFISYFLWNLQFQKKEKRNIHRYKYSPSFCKINKAVPVVTLTE